jgi:hypothetical protein
LRPNGYDLRSRRRDRACTSYDLRSRRRKASYRFGAEEKEESLISDFIKIAKISPQAAASVIKLGLTALLQKYDVKEPGAINMEEYNREVKPLYDYLKDGLTPMKFGVDPLDMSALKAAAMRELEADRERQEKADEKHKKEEEAYNEKLGNMNLKVLYSKSSNKKSSNKKY